MSYGLDSIKVIDGVTHFHKRRLADIAYNCDWEGSSLSDEEYNSVEMAREVLKEITDTTRWSVHHMQVFKLGDKYYRTYFSEGATEMQDESPYQYDNEWVSVTEVEPKEVLVTKYVPVQGDAK